MINVAQKDYYFFSISVRSQNALLLSFYLYPFEHVWNGEMRKVKCR